MLVQPNSIPISKPRVAMPGVGLECGGGAERSGGGGELRNRGPVKLQDCGLVDLRRWELGMGQDRIGRTSNFRMLVSVHTLITSAAVNSSPASQVLLDRRVFM